MRPNRSVAFNNTRFLISGVTYPDLKTAFRTAQAMGFAGDSQEFQAKIRGGAQTWDAILRSPTKAKPADKASKLECLQAMRAVDERKREIAADQARLKRDAEDWQ